MHTFEQKKEKQIFKPKLELVMLPISTNGFQPKLEKVLAYFDRYDLSWKLPNTDENNYKQIIKLPKRKIKEGKKFHYYTASPFFNPEQEERLESLQALLEIYGYTYFSPHIDGIDLKPDASQEEREKVFKENIYGISNAEQIFAVTDGRDMGTIFESGAAYSLNIPIHYFAETLPEGATFNVMLALSAKSVSTNKLEFSEMLANDSKGKKYEGKIR